MGEDVISTESPVREIRTPGLTSGGEETGLRSRTRHWHCAKAASKRRLPGPTAERASPRLYDRLGNRAPLSGNAIGGSGDERRGPITRRDVAMVLGFVIRTLSVAAYLHSKINVVRTAVHESARELAGVRAEIAALRRDVERLGRHASMNDSTDCDRLSMARISR